MTFLGFEIVKNQIKTSRKALACVAAKMITERGTTRKSDRYKRAVLASQFHVDEAIEQLRAAEQCLSEAENTP